MKENDAIFPFELGPRHFGEDNLTILYYQGEKEYTLLATPEQAADLFKELGWINDYTGSGELVAIEWEPIYRNYSDHSGEHVEKAKLTTEEWVDFVNNFWLSDHDAMRVIDLHEAKKAKERRLRASSVDVMVDRILKNPA